MKRDSGKSKSVRFFQKINNWIEARVRYDGISEPDFLKRKAWVYADIFSLLPVSLLTILAIILHLPFFAIYGYALIFMLVLTGIVYLTVKKNTDWMALIDQSYIIIATFVVILYLGGIPYSGGLVINGITVILTAIILRNIGWLIWLTVLYISTIVALAFLQPYLTVPEWWTMPLNILFFVLNVVWMTIYLVSVIIQHIRYRTQVEEEENKRLKELDEAKTQLYTNISHEFRTPLTVILGMAEQMESNPDQWSEKGIEKIKQNSYTLLNLVNKMLDHAKMEAGAMQVHPVQGNIVLYLKYVVESFHVSAESKQVNLVFESAVPEIIMDYDPDKILSVFSNLISNAIKFSRDNGQIVVTVSADHDQSLLNVDVRDNGVGIPEEKLPYIFDRFYQVNENSMHHSEGSGLGLSLVKEFIKLLRGDISVTSKPGQETVFHVTLPVTNNAVWGKEPEQPQSYSGDANTAGQVTGQLSGSDEEEDLSEMLLIVEDNADVVEYLISVLEKDYRIESAQNGKIGLEKALKLVPDIIISDVMMPVMDGFALLEKVKNDMRTSHIPVLLLTAKADMASKLEGLDKGADAYLSKPFNKDELCIRVRKLLEIRKRLRDRYASIALPVHDQDTSFRIEDTFMQKVQDVLKENIGNENFTINQLCSVLFMSRTQLYRKFKALSEKTLSAYFRSLRLSRAKELLHSSDLNITQIAFEVGFKDLSHFSYSFKKEYGISPSEII